MSLLCAFAPGRACGPGMAGSGTGMLGFPTEIVGRLLCGSTCCSVGMVLRGS